MAYVENDSNTRALSQGAAFSPPNDNVSPLHGPPVITTLSQGRGCRRRSEGVDIDFQSQLSAGLCPLAMAMAARTSTIATR